MIEPRRVAACFDAHAASLLLYARQLDAADADGLVQEAYVRLMGEPREPPNAAAWLALTLRRLAIDRRRSWFRRRRRERTATPAAWFEATSDDALDGRQAAELLAALPPRQREVVVLRVWQGLRFAEIASIVGTSDSTAHDDYKAALATLRVRMG